MKTKKKLEISAENTSKYSSSFMAVPTGSLTLIRPENIKRTPTKILATNAIDFIAYALNVIDVLLIIYYC